MSNQNHDDVTLARGLRGGNLALTFHLHRDIAGKRFSRLTVLTPSNAITLMDGEISELMCFLSQCLEAEALAECRLWE